MKEYIYVGEKKMYYPKRTYVLGDMIKTHGSDWRYIINPRQMGFREQKMERVFSLFALSFNGFADFGHYLCLKSGIFNFCRSEHHRGNTFFGGECNGVFI